MHNCEKVILIIKVSFKESICHRETLVLNFLFLKICIVQKRMIFIIRAVLRKDLILKFKKFRFPKK